MEIGRVQLPCVARRLVALRTTGRAFRYPLQERAGQPHQLYRFSARQDALTFSSFLLLFRGYGGSAPIGIFL